MAQLDYIVYLLSNRQLMFISATVEMLVAIMLLKASITNKDKLIILLTLSFLFVVYRLLLLYLGVKTCRCLGSMSEWLGMKEITFSRLSMGLLLYIIAFSMYYLLTGKHRQPAGEQ